jgi:putative transcriptional regulator
MTEKRKGLILARKKARLSQQQLADQLGVNRVTLARWELGDNDPSLATALRLGQILGKRVEQLFGDEPVFSAEEVAEARRLARSFTRT